MLGLRQKLSLGFGGLLAIIMLIGIQSIIHLTQLGQSIDVILRENYRSVVACQDMKESLERIDSALLFTLLGYEKQGKELIVKHQALFEKALAGELDNVTVPGEGEKAALLKTLFLRYKDLIPGIEDSAIPLRQRRADYFDRALPLFGQIKESADAILTMNQENMSSANNRARSIAGKAREQMYLLLLAGLAVAVGFTYFTGRWILRPINRLIYSAGQIRQGNLELVVQSNSRDELGRLLDTFNEMASSLREFRRSDRSRLERIQHATQQAFNSLPDAIAVIDPDGQIEVETEPARDVFGLRRNEWVQDSGFPVIADLYTQVMKSGHKAVQENRNAIIQVFIKGEERFFRPEAIPILDSQGEPAGVVMVLKDVTQLRQHDDMKRGIISTVSHQLKTPLTSIRMAVHVLLEEKVGSLTTKQVELLVAAEEDSERLYRIINDLLEISRIESGRVQMNLTAANPNTMVLDAVDMLSLSAHDTGVTLRTDLSDNLPEVWADTAQVGHVFANLLSNSLRYTGPGGVITVSTAADDEFVRFLVSDTGKGIPAQYSGRIFEPFFRAPDQGRQTGAGLGLAIVKEIIEAHGGNIAAESREGTGSVFTFTLRRADRNPDKEGHCS